MQRICHSLAKAGYEVQLIGRQQPRSIPLTTASYSQKRLKCFFHSGKFFYLEYNLRLLLYLIRQNTDAICAIDLDTLLPVFLTARLRRKILVYDAHEYFSELPELQQRPLIKKIWTYLEGLLVPRVKHAYTVGKALAVALEERYDVPFAVVRNLPLRQSLPPDPALIRKAQELKTQFPNTTFLLYQGALNEGRGIETAIRALHHLNNTQLWLAGEGPLKQQILDIITAEKLQKRVHFWGYLSPQSLQSLSPFATIGLNLLSDHGLNYYYSLANKTFDYLHAELPAIHMDFPEYRQLNAQHPTALLLPKLSEDELVDAISRLQKEPGLYDQLKGNCQILLKEYCWENEEKRLIQFWESILPDEANS